MIRRDRIPSRDKVLQYFVSRWYPGSDDGAGSYPNPPYVAQNTGKQVVAAGKISGSDLERGSPTADENALLELVQAARCAISIEYDANFLNNRSKNCTTGTVKEIQKKFVYSETFKRIDNLEL
ncbi:hypothetical protein EVAR_33000_1 [Eumeta japonica]|uniref:Uncharacterized protein n=1 Tax=Eumeta variegata TaxID=151549 RepID=A0A4C1VRF7_EUMVA|nr:hypothetical protein EVAR_33000_1 [Eumeta japonica]